jgi:hypothetical protein
MADDDDDDDADDYERDLVFVIMSFAPAMDDVYASIKDECERLSLRSHRVDENVSSALIIDDITDGIERCEFIICDLSDQKPNVYYELGYAHGVGNEPRDIFLVARAGTQLAFDLAGYRVHFYASTEELRQLIRTRFSRMVAETRRKEASGR